MVQNATMAPQKHSSPFQYSLDTAPNHGSPSARFTEGTDGLQSQQSERGLLEFDLFGFPNAIELLNASTLSDLFKEVADDSPMNLNEASSSSLEPVLNTQLKQFPEQYMEDDNLSLPIHRLQTISPWLENEILIPGAASFSTFISSYFTRFHPLFPILHRPSFSPNSSHPALVLIVCALGSIYCNVPASAFVSLRLAELSRRVLTHSLEKDPEMVCLRRQ